MSAHPLRQFRDFQLLELVEIVDGEVFPAAVLRRLRDAPPLVVLPVGVLRLVEHVRSLLELVPRGIRRIRRTALEPRLLVNLLRIVRVRRVEVFVLRELQRVIDVPCAVLFLVVKLHDARQEVHGTVRDDDAHGLLSFLPLRQERNAVRRALLISNDERIFVIQIWKETREGNLHSFRQAENQRLAELLDADNFVPLSRLDVILPRRDGQDELVIIRRKDELALRCSLSAEGKGGEVQNFPDVRHERHQNAPP